MLNVPTEKVGLHAEPRPRVRRAGRYDLYSGRRTRLYIHLVAPLLGRIRRFWNFWAMRSFNVDAGIVPTPSSSLDEEGSVCGWGELEEAGKRPGQLEASWSTPALYPLTFTNQTFKPLDPTRFPLNLGICTPIDGNDSKPSCRDSPGYFSRFCLVRFP